MEKEMKKGIIAIMVILCLGLMGFVGFMKFSEDNTPPEIQFQDNEIVYTAGDSYDGLLDGVTATDNKDGDVTESLVVESVYPNEDGQTATIVYVARDSRNNVGKANKVVTYRAAADDQAATSDATEKTATDESADAQPSTTPEATDTPIPTPSVTPDAGSDTEKASADTTSEDDSEEDDSTDDLSAEAPRIKLSTNRVTIKKGESINRISYVESVTDDKDSKETLYKRIEISGDTFDKDTPGTYEQTYYVVDTDGNRSNEAKLTIVVQ